MSRLPNQTTRMVSAPRTPAEEEEFQREERLDRNVKRAMRFSIIGVPLFFLLLCMGWRLWPDPSFVCTVNSLIKQEPKQTRLASLTPWNHNGATIRPLADYEITALLMSKCAYTNDGASSISKWDLSMIWGAMTDPEILGGVELRQYNRCTAAMFHSKPAKPSWKIVLSQLSNVHTIPATPAIQAQLDALQAGQVVTLKGKLVSAEIPGGLPWTSSTTRYDSYDGACEIMWVDEVSSVTQDEWRAQQSANAAHANTP